MTTRFTLSSLAAAIALLTNPATGSDTLEEVVITASRLPTPLREVGASVSVITEQDIQLQAATTLNELLRNQPGITSTNSGGLGKISSVSIRGEEGYRTLIMVDGVEMSDPTGTQSMTHVEHLNMNSDVERVEILRGPQGFVYGADAGGVINIFTRTTEEGFEGRLAADIGSYNTQNLNASLSAGNSRMDGFASVTALHSDGFNAMTYDTSGEEDGYDNLTAHTRGGVNITEKLRAQVVLRRTHAENEYDAYSSSSQTVTPDSDSEFTQSVGRISLAYTGEQTRQSLAYAQTNVKREFFSNGESSYGSRGKLKKLEYLGSYLLSKHLTAVWGADNKEEIIDAADGDPKQSRTQLGIFAELQASLQDSIYVTAGLRNDDNEDFGTYNSYRLTTAWLPVQNDQSTLKLRASAGSGFRAPALSEIDYNNGPWASGAAANLALDPESSEGLDLGLDYYRQLGATQSIDLGITLFSQKVEDEIYFDLIGYSGYLQADGESTSKGVEFTTDYAINSHLSLVFNTTYNTTEDRAGEPRPRRPQNTSNLGVRVNGMDNALNLLINLYDARNADDIDGSSLDNYNLLSASANYSWNQLLFSLRLDNLSDEDYALAGGYNNAGRTVSAGVQLNF
ncbi:TonB-dependent receptor plug domain-containing protein [Teredinibacter turnerae]|uniref:TonB-dependent receptor plug domain-containing protein n=1 Tax=Teredinibacter turnerae TaxID=2426 RepID=UPI00037FED9C|nr:TonB-dependent receptor [Teredinibacter turnerae]